MSQKFKMFSIMLVLLVFGYLFASPYLTIYQIRQAIEQEDSAALASHIDFPSVRQSLKDQVNAQMLQDMPQAPSSERGLAAFGAILASSMLDKVVDVMVSPQGVAMLMQGKQLKDSLPLQANSDFQTPPSSESTSSTHAEKASYKGRYQSFNQFAVEIQHPHNRFPTKIILQRTGLSWKVTQIQLPIEQNR
ncbi:DUF2939 domain-containing protein [Acinetobacter suaedae]|uniref:DUF2939 domain-containing protein n=1 Tax=Acinetobacter suaedae TaxID=2609668 RepID=A0A5P1UNU5_9GAMM|nr:DUF2939 domain-containing protein [Acinetobacter sp. C16S1]QER38334.1 DUF2939 domain-containing protein [Acinetobacter sp. C16S1]